jgi:hypothetical protein
MQIASFLGRIILSYVALLALPYFLHYLINGTIFTKKIIKHEIRVLIFCTTLSETFLILREIQRDVFINVHRSSRKVPVIRGRFY